MNFAEKVELVRRSLRIVRGQLQEKTLTWGVHEVTYENLIIKWTPGWRVGSKHEDGELTLSVKKGGNYLPEADPDLVFRTKVQVPSFTFRVMNISWTDEKIGESVLVMLRPKMLLDDLAGV